jgi:hypothetical protein
VVVVEVDVKEEEEKKYSRDEETNKKQNTQELNL